MQSLKEWLKSQPFDLEWFLQKMSRKTRLRSMTNILLVFVQNKAMQNSLYLYMQIMCLYMQIMITSVHFHFSGLSNSLRLHGPQHTRPPCPSPTPGAWLKLMSIESVMPSNHLIFGCPLLLPPTIFPSIRVFSNESALCIRWPKYWSFSFSISPSNEYSGLVSFRMDWLDLLAVQGTLKSLLQHHSSNASILQRSAFFTVQLAHPYMITGKTIALTRRTFVGKVISLLFNMLSRLVITFLPRSKHLLISWLKSPSAVILVISEVQIKNTV